MSAVHALLGIIALLFVTVPAGKTWHFYPDNMTFALGCSDSNSIRLFGLFKFSVTFLD